MLGCHGQQHEVVAAERAIRRCRQGQQRFRIPTPQEAPLKVAVGIQHLKESLSCRGADHHRQHSFLKSLRYGGACRRHLYWSRASAQGYCLAMPPPSAPKHGEPTATTRTPQPDHAMCMRV